MTKMLRSDFFSVLATDLKLPGMGGIELAAELRAIRPDLMTLFISGMSEDKFLEMGADMCQATFVAKPFDSRQVRTALQGLLTDNLIEHE